MAVLVTRRLRGLLFISAVQNPSFHKHRKGCNRDKRNDWITIRGNHSYISCGLWRITLTVAQVGAMSRIYNNFCYGNAIEMMSKILKF